MTRFIHPDTLKEEEKEQLIDSITAALRWHLLLDNKQVEDDQHAAVLIKLLEDLMEK